MAFCKNKMTGAAVALAIVSPFFYSCGSGEEAVVALDRSNLHTQFVRDIYTLISDSGIVKYRLTSPEWYVYDKADTPYWYFPKGLLLEQFDENMEIMSSVASKLAHYYNNEKLWKLEDSVRAKNTKGENFETDLLFWNQEEKKVYSNERIKIIQQERVIIGKGFDSNESFTNYVIRNPEGIFPVKEE